MADKSMVDIAEHVVARAEELLPQFTDAAVRGLVYQTAMDLAIFVFIIGGLMTGALALLCFMVCDGDVAKGKSAAKRFCPWAFVIFAMLSVASQWPVFLDPAAVLAYRLIN